MRYGRIGRLAAALGMVAVFALSLSVSAAENDGYCYNRYGESVPAPESYRTESVVYGSSLEGGFGMADDLFAYRDRLYVLNQKTGSILVFDRELQPLGNFPVTQNGQELPLIDASGLFFWEHDGETSLYIADTLGKRILYTDAEGRVVGSIGKPDSELFPQELDFVPTKVVVGGDGTIYAICRGVYKGAATFSQSGEFLGFYGSNRIEVTAAVLLEYWWKSLLNETQVGRMQNSVPIEYTNFCIDTQGFIYTCTRVTDNSTGELKRMNAKSVNVFPDGNFGDLEDAWLKSTHLDTAFVDVALMRDGILTALDTQRGRVFLYDKEGNLLTVFGNTGSFVGTFRTPSAVECIGEDIYVLDPYKDCLVRLSPTRYGKTLLNAAVLYQEGRYEEALTDWYDVLQRNGNYETAYTGIGKALMGTGRYEEAMEYFRLGEDRESYSQAYEEVRKQRMAGLTVPLIVGLLVLFVLSRLYAYFWKGRPTECDLRTCGFGRCVGTTLFHPVSGFTALLGRIGSRRALRMAYGSVVAAFLTAVLVRQATGFIFNPYPTDRLNVWILLAAVVVVYAAFTVSNRLVCTLFNGNGSMTEIRFVTGLSLWPAMLVLWLRTALSTCLIADEQVFLDLLTAVGILWSLGMLLSGLCVIHEYSPKQALLSVIFTLIGMAIMAFIALLVWALYRQIGAFAESILHEFSYMNR